MSNGFFEQNLQKNVCHWLSKVHHRRNLHIRNSLGTKFRLKLTFLDFWFKLTQKGYFQSKK